METKNEVINKINDMAKNAKEAGIAIKNLERAMGIFCEKVNMDMDEFKQQMVLKALKDGAEGKGRDYIGNLDADAAEVIEKLIKERDENSRLYECVDKQKEEYFERYNDLVDTVMKYDARRREAMDILRNADKGRTICALYEIKKKYTYQEMLDIVEKVALAYREQMLKAWSVLEKNENSEPRNKKPIRFA